MSQENVELVRSALQAYVRGDHAGASAYLAPNVVWEIGQELPAHGPAAVRRMWKRWESEWEELETVAEDFIDAGDNVVVTISYRGRGRVSGIQVTERIFEVHTFRDGQCVRKIDFQERSDALEAAGLRE
jgi:ketosteroid isomerase-like protein